MCLTRAKMLEEGRLHNLVSCSPPDHGPRDPQQCLGIAHQGLQAAGLQDRKGAQQICCRFAGKHPLRVIKVDHLRGSWVGGGCVPEVILQKCWLGLEGLIGRSGIRAWWSLDLDNG